MAKAKLTDKDKESIKALLTAGEMTNTAIAKQFGVSTGLIGQLKSKWGLSGSSKTPKSKKASVTSTVTTHKQLVNLVRKETQPAIKAVQSIVGANNEVTINVSFKIGKKSYDSLDELLTEAQTAQAKLDKKAELEAKKAELAKLEAELAAL